MKATVMANQLIDAADQVAAIGCASSVSGHKLLAIDVIESHLVVNVVTDTLAVMRRVACIETPTPTTVPLTIYVEELGTALRQFSRWAPVELSVGLGPSLSLRVSGDTATIPIRGVGRSVPSLPSDRPRTVEIAAADLSDLASVTRLIGSEKFQAQFNQWVVHFSAGEALSVCGDGGIFAAVERREMRSLSASGEWTFIVNASQVRQLRCLLNSSGGTQVSIRDWGGDEGFAVVMVNDVQLHLFGVERLPYPDARLFIERPYRSRFLIEMADVADAARALGKAQVRAYRRQHQPHWTAARVDLANPSLTLTALDNSRVSHRIPLVSSDIAEDVPSDCDATILTHNIGIVAQMADTHGYAEVEMTEGTKPLVIRFTNEPTLTGHGWVRDIWLGGLRRLTMFVGLRPPPETRSTVAT